MRSLLRAPIVVVAVTLAGTALPSVADQTDSATCGAHSRHDRARASDGPHATATSHGPSRRTRPAPPRARCAGSPSRSTRVTSSATTTTRRRPTDRSRPAGSRSPATRPGTATNSGVAEATVNFRLAQAVRKRLRALGADVRMTRTTNSREPLGTLRRRARDGSASGVGARLMVSLHADGASSSGRGFHVIAPTRRDAMDDRHRRALAAAREVAARRAHRTSAYPARTTRARAPA